MNNDDNQAFPLFNEKLLADQVKLISWCPTADLVLLVSPTNAVSLYRGGTVKIWSFDHETESIINNIAWKPNGKEFVLGCENGIVHKVDVTYHSPRISRCWTSSTPTPVTSLVWINYEFKKKQMDIEGFDTKAFDLESALPTLSLEPPEEPVSRMPMLRRRKPSLPIKPLDSNADIQTLLFIGNAKGQLYIILNGIYPVGFVEIDNNEKDLDIKDISVAYNVSCLKILTKPTQAPKADFVCYTLNTQFLEDRKEEIFSISEIQTQLKYLLQYTHFVMDVLKRHHDSYAKLTSNIAKEASNYIMNHNEQATAMPEVELIGTLATGSVTETLQEFFIDYLTSQRIKQWETNANHGYQNSLRIVCEHILPACDRIQLELSKLMGYSLWKERYGDFLETESVQKCIEWVRNLVSEIHHFTKALSSLIKSFTAFIAWITIVSQKVFDPNSVEFENQTSLCEEPELVSKYLATDFIKDSLAEYFVSLTDSNVPEKNLVQLLANLASCCDGMLEKPSKTVSTKVKVTSMYPFQLDNASVSAEYQDRVISLTTVGGGPDQHIYYALLQSKPGPKLTILKTDFGDSVMQYSSVELSGVITDFEFFDSKELGLLTQIDDDTTILQALLLEDLDFENLVGPISKSSVIKPSRTQELQRMIHVKLGCNGLPRRRILCVIALNGLLKVYSMDEEEADEEDDSMEE